MPTKQSLGYTASTMYYAELEKDCDEEIYKVIQKHFDENIYIDNFWLGSGDLLQEKRIICAIPLTGTKRDFRIRRASLRKWNRSWESSAIFQI